jgi:type IV secretion system protein VirB11
LVQEAVATVPRRLIAEAIDLIVFIKGRGSARRIEEVVELKGLDSAGDYLLETPHGLPTIGHRP